MSDVQIWHKSKLAKGSSTKPICFRHAVQNIAAGRMSAISEHNFTLETLIYEDDFTRCDECDEERRWGATA